MYVRKTLTAIAVIGLAVAAPMTASADTSDALKSKLSGSQVVPGPGDPNGKGTFKATVDGDQFCYKLQTTKIGPVTDVSIYAGGRGETGDVVVMLGDARDLRGCLTVVADADDTTETLSESELAAILADPGQFYVESRTIGYPGGAIRGQLS